MAKLLAGFRVGDPFVLFVPGQPVPQGSHTPAVTKDGRPYLRESNSQRLRPWRKAMKEAAKEVMGGRPKFAGPVALALTFVFERPKSHEGGQSWPSGKPIGDSDKYARAAADSLTGTVYYDDVQIVSTTIRKVWARYDIDYPPGVLIWCNHVPGFSVPAVVQIG